jgi:hypothetical protein
VFIVKKEIGLGSVGASCFKIDFPALVYSIAILVKNALHSLMKPVMPLKRMLIDQELIALLKNDDRDAFAEIYRRYWTVMYMHALKMLRDEDDARDIIQETFTALWLKRECINSDVNLAGYLFISTKNKNTSTFHII